MVRNNVNWTWKINLVTQYVGQAVVSCIYLKLNTSIIFLFFSFPFSFGNSILSLNGVLCKGHQQFWHFRLQKENTEKKWKIQFRVVELEFFLFFSRRPIFALHFRVMKLLDMKLVGRNFYDPTSAMVLQQHRSVVFFSSLLNVLETIFSLWLPYVVQKSQQYFMIVNTIYQLNLFQV